MDTFNNCNRLAVLPEELLVTLLKLYLSAIDAKSLARTDERAKRIIEDDAFWTAMLRRDFRDHSFTVYNMRPFDVYKFAQDIITNF